MSEPMNDIREEIELPPLSHRYRGECTWDRCDPLGQREDQLEVAHLANREKDAEIARLKGIIAADDERLLVASVRVGFPFYGCDTADWLAEEILSLRASAGEKDVEIARLRAEKLEAGELMSRVAVASGKQGALKSKLERAEAALIAGEKWIEILREMVNDDAFAELCQGIGEEPSWLNKAKVVIHEYSLMPPTLPHPQQRRRAR